MPARRPRLGQHFLTDKNILARIADAVAPAPGDVVLEIGPGKGDLTRALLGRGARVVAIEKDRDLARGLEALAGARVVAADALQEDWHAVTGERSFVVCGNIPYYITSPLIEKALTPPLPRRVVFLVQAEVADRLAARPGSKTYGALSVGVQAVARVERLFNVGAGAFRPPPKVASAVVRLTPLDPPLLAPDEHPALRRFVTACFSRRRKQLRNAVAHAAGVPVTAAAAGLEAEGINPRARPEELGVPEYLRLLRREW